MCVCYFIVENGMNNPKVVHLLYAFERWKMGPAQVDTATKLRESRFLTPKPQLSSLQQKVSWKCMETGDTTLQTLAF